jgi:hypothetical protein
VLYMFVAVCAVYVTCCLILPVTHRKSMSMPSFGVMTGPNWPRFSPHKPPPCLVECRTEFCIETFFVTSQMDDVRSLLQAAMPSVLSLPVVPQSALGPPSSVQAVQLPLAATPR